MEVCGEGMFDKPSGLVRRRARGLMYRIDELLSQARLVRIRRSARRQAMAERSMRRSLVDDEAWFDEQRVVASVLAGLAKGPGSGTGAGSVAEAVAAPGSGSGRRRRTDVIDLSPLSPFVVACIEALSAVVERFGADGAMGDALAAAWYPALQQAVSKEHPVPDGTAVEGAAGGERASPALKPRLDALEDLAALAIEWAMFDAVARIARRIDVARPVSSRSAPDDIVVEDGRAWRASRRAKEAERQGRRRAQAALERRIAALALEGVSEADALKMERRRLAGDGGGEDRPSVLGDGGA